MLKVIPRSKNTLQGSIAIANGQSKIRSFSALIVCILQQKAYNLHSPSKKQLKEETYLDVKFLKNPR